MTDSDVTERIHELDVTVWVGKGGVDPVAEELKSQVDQRDLVKVKFLRAARGGDATESLAADLGEVADVELVETRGNTAVYR
ncbi:MAG: RNA-binding protein [Halobacteriales archaeon]|jgi:RNA-binding protein